MPKETEGRLLKIIKSKGSGRAETAERARKGLGLFYLRFRSIKEVTILPVRSDAPRREKYFLGA